MRQFIHWSYFLFPALFLMGSYTYANPAHGTISGTVKDSEDRPVAGAIVQVFNPKEELALLKTVTDKNGRFLASNLSPGSYKLQAVANGYKPILVSEASVTPSQTTIFNLKLQKASVLLSIDQEKNSYKYVLRRNRTVFQWDNLEEVVEEKPFIRETHGFVNLTCANSLSSQPFAANSTNLNFALAQMVSENVELVVAGQTGLAVNSPQRLDVQASILANDEHKLNIAIGYGQLPTISSNEKNPIRRGEINQYTIQATDKWRIAGPVVIVYGFDYSHFDGAKQTNFLFPRLNLDLQVSPNDQLFAAIYSPNGASVESSAEFETTKVDFSGPVQLISLFPQPTIENSQRYEVGYSHTFKNRARFETAMFWDKLSQRTLAFVDSNNFELSETADLSINTISQTGDSRGVRVVFSQPITSNISSFVGYSFGQGQNLTFTEDGQPNISVGYFHVFTGKVDARLVSTGTKISTVVRLTSPNALLAIDPFQKQLKMMDPNISVYLTQSVPMFSFIPGRWEATLDARNLLDLRLENGRGKAALTQYWRTIKGGVSIRF